MSASDYVLTVSWLLASLRGSGPYPILARLPRMADYAVWVRACETAIWSAGMHMAAYDTNRADAVDVFLDANPVAAMRAISSSTFSVSTVKSSLS
jgi:hypothetical protein